MPPLLPRARGGWARRVPRRRPASPPERGADSRPRDASRCGASRGRFAGAGASVERRWGPSGSAARAPRAAGARRGEDVLCATLARDGGGRGPRAVEVDAVIARTRAMGARETSCALDEASSTTSPRRADGRAASSVERRKRARAMPHIARRRARATRLRSSVAKTKNSFVRRGNESRPDDRHDCDATVSARGPAIHDRPVGGSGPRRRGARLTGETMSQGRRGSRSREAVDEVRNLRRASPSLVDGVLIESFTPPRATLQARSRVEGQGRGREGCRREAARVHARSPRAWTRRRGRAAARSRGLTWRRGIASLEVAGASPRWTERSIGSKGPRLDRSKALERREPRGATTVNAASPAPWHGFVGG
jgi:hypothetical protein